MIPPQAALAPSTRMQLLLTALAAALVVQLIHHLCPAAAAAAEHAQEQHGLDETLRPVRPVESFRSGVGVVEVWPATSHPLLVGARVGASKLTLFGGKGGLALPAYADSPKLHYVIQGE